MAEMFRCAQHLGLINIAEMEFDNYVAHLLRCFTSFRMTI